MKCEREHIPNINKWLNNGNKMYKLNKIFLFKLEYKKYTKIYSIIINWIVNINIRTIKFVDFNLVGTTKINSKLLHVI